MAHFVCPQLRQAPASPRTLMAAKKAKEPQLCLTGKRPWVSDEVWIASLFLWQAQLQRRKAGDNLAGAAGSLSEIAEACRLFFSTPTKAAWIRLRPPIP